MSGSLRQSWFVGVVAGLRMITLAVSENSLSAIALSLKSKGLF
jgi:hypothetical protein